MISFKTLFYLAVNEQQTRMIRVQASLKLYLALLLSYILKHVHQISSYSHPRLITTKTLPKSNS